MRWVMVDVNEAQALCKRIWGPYVLHVHHEHIVLRMGPLRGVAWLGRVSLSKVNEAIADTRRCCSGWAPVEALDFLRGRIRANMVSL